MMEVPAKVRRRLTSVKRASDPYDAEYEQMLVWKASKRVKVWFYGSLLTEIVCGDYHAVLELDAEY